MNAAATATTAPDARVFGKEYLLPSAAIDLEERPRLELLQRLRDPYSQRLLGSIVNPGMRCLEIGAGLGSMSRWLAGHVGDRGQVVAIDVNTDTLDAPGCEIRRHDVVSDAPEILGLESFDVVYARHVLEHLGHSAGVIVERWRELLKPGGTLVIEGGGDVEIRAADPWHARSAAFDLMLEQAAAAFKGYASAGRYLPALLRRCRFVNIRHGASGAVNSGASDAARLLIATLDAFLRSLGARGTDTAGAALLRECLADPEFLFFGPVHHAVAGQRPSAGV